MGRKISGPPFCIVLWDDAWGAKVDEVSLELAHEAHRPTPMETAGWLIHEDEKGVSVCNERYSELKKDYRGRTFIPASMIIEIQFINLTKPRKRHEPPKSNEPGRPADADALPGADARSGQ